MIRQPLTSLLVAALLLPLSVAAQDEDEPVRERRVREIWEQRPTTEEVSAGIDSALAIPDWSPRTGDTRATSWSKVADVMVDPDNVHNKVGRVRCAAWAFDHDLQERILWVGTSSGGLYKLVPLWIFPFHLWVPVSFSLEGSPAVGAFLVHRRDSHKILVGTGDRGRGWDVGSGLYRTADGGATWTKITMSPQPASFEKLVFDVDDVNGNTVMAATQTGVWRSTNFGTSWTRVFDSGTSQGVTDIAQDPDTGTWLLGIPGTGVVHCSVLPGICVTGTGIAAPIGRVSVAVAPSDPDWVFALVAGRYRCSGGTHPLCTSTLQCAAAGNGSCTQVDDGMLNGVYRSHASAQYVRIEPQGIDTISGGQGFHAHAIAVDPDAPERVIVGLAGVQMTFNATATNAADVCWRRNVGSSCSNCCTLPGGLTIDIGHADQTSLQFVPDLVDPGNTDILATNDGGVYLYDWQSNTLDDRYSSYKGLNVSQTYPLAMDMAAGDHERLLIGTQDNGVVRVDLGGAGSYDYLPGPGGETGADGGPVSISASNPNHMGTSLGLPYSRMLSTDGTNWSDVDAGLSEVWFPAVRFDRMPGYATIFSNDDRTVYFRYPWNNPGDPWQVANPNHLLPAGVAISWLETARTDYTTLYLTDANSATNGTALYVMDSFTTGGDLGNLGWEDRSPRPFGAPPPPGGMVSADRTASHPEMVYFTTGGYRPSRAYLSTNRAVNWWEVTGDLAPALSNVSLWQLVSHPDDFHKLFLAAETGIYRSDDGGVTWFRYMDGLPAVVKARSLEIVATGSQQARLVVATWGHGLWRRDVEFDFYGDAIFSDDFESGDAGNWSSVAP